MSTAPITDPELWQFAADWYRKLDVHVPGAAILPELGKASKRLKKNSPTIPN